MSYTWSQEKNNRNTKKHNISFTKAMRVFDDENHLQLFDVAHSDTEDRYIAISAVDGVAGHVMVVYTERGETIRLISARILTKKQFRRYLREYNDQRH